MDLERQKFDRDLAESLRNAETEPSSEVWAAIELELERKQHKMLLLRATWYKYATAASLFVAVALAAWNFSLLEENQAIVNKYKSAGDEQLPKTSSNREVVTPQELNQTEGPASTVYNQTNKSRAVTNINSYGKVPDLETSVSSNVVASDAVGNADEPRSLALFSNATRDRQLPVLVNLPKPRIEKQAQDPVARMFEQLAALEKSMQGSDSRDRTKSTPGNLWTALGVSSGTFANPFASPSGQQAQAASVSFNNSALPEVSRNGMAVGFGFELGKELTEHWVLLGGLNFQNLAQEYDAVDVRLAAQKTTVQVAAHQPQYDYLDISVENSLSLPYRVTDQVAYVGVPIQVGYRIAVRKWGVTLNSGLSTDAYIRNAVLRQDVNSSPIVYNGDRNQVYSRFLFSALAGAEISYSLSDRYHLALNPALRYPLNSVLSEQSGLQAQPMFFNLGFKLKYNLQ